MPIKALLLFTLLAARACDPIEDKSWYDNEQISLVWTTANPETGYRPSDVSMFYVCYYPQDMSADQVRKDYVCNQDLVSFPVETGRYDLLAITSSDCVVQDKYYRSARIEFETEIDSLQNRVIVSGGDEMLYKGYMSNIAVNEKQKQTRKIIMKRLLKKITYIVRIFDYKELTGKVHVSISGMATKMLLFNEKLDADSQAIMATDIDKLGKGAETELGVHTTYKGSVYVLGVAGNNVLDISYVDSRGQQKKMQIDATSYLKSWDTDEAVISISVNSTQQTTVIDRWDSVSSDIVINNEDV